VSAALLITSVVASLYSHLYKYICRSQRGGVSVLEHSYFSVSSP
jgi:hypothetical protein